MSATDSTKMTVGSLLSGGRVYVDARDLANLLRLLASTMEANHAKRVLDIAEQLDGIKVP